MLACSTNVPPSNWTIVLRTVDAFAPIMAAATVLGLVLLLLLPRLLPHSRDAPLSPRRVFPQSPQRAQPTPARTSTRGSGLSR